MRMNKKNLNLINKTGLTYGWPVDESFFNSLLAQDDQLMDLSIVLVDRQEIRRFNREYRQKDSVTDVLSFPYDDFTGGDILLCPKEIFCYSTVHRVPYQVRFLHLVVHSMVHLKGYDHYGVDEAALMFAQEEQFWTWICSTLRLHWKLETGYTYQYSLS
jgi:probable rRNA maturation factor